MKNKNGYAGLIAIIAIVTIAALWMGYEFRKNWLGSENADLSKGLESGDAAGDIQAKSINGQLDDLRKNVQSAQDASSKQISDELNK